MSDNIKNETIAFRDDGEITRRLEAVTQKLSKKLGGVQLTKSSVARTAVLQGLTKLELSL